MDNEKTTLFDGKVIVHQPKFGYRFAIDSLLLADHVLVKPKQTVMELGIGVGATSLALAYKYPDLLIHGIELQEEAFELLTKNVAENGWTDRFTLYNGNLKDRLAPGHFYDHVIMNPPFYDSKSYTESIHSHKTISHQETAARLKDWIDEAYRLLKSRGYIVIVHTAPRCNEILQELHRFGGIELFPVFTKQNEPGKRVIIRARKDVDTPFVLHYPILLNRSIRKNLI